MKKFFYSGAALAALLVVGPNAGHADTGLAGMVQAARPAASVILVQSTPDKAAADARALIERVANRGIGFLSAGKMSKEEQRQSFRALLRDSFDLPTIGRFALGKYWRVATAAQRAEYQRLFETMLVNVYSERFGSYNGQVMKTIGAQTLEGGDVMVASQIIPADGGEKIGVDWRVRRSDGRLRIVDVVVEGVSMAVTQRSDFGSVIDRNNGDVAALLQELKSPGRKG
jgi:phospholipid transport system substrate-binding protein